MKIGITGSIATGKTTVSNIISQEGYQVIDADVLSHEALNVGCAPYYEVVSYFKDEILESDQSINRKKLGEIIFNSKSAKDKLESIVHPYVIQKIGELTKDVPLEKTVFVVVPLLYEAHLENLFDKVIVVASTKEEQLRRLMKRDEITKEYAMKKIANQIDINEKVKRADIVINSEASDLNSVVKGMLEELKGGSK